MRYQTILVALLIIACCGTISCGDEVEDVDNNSETVRISVNTGLYYSFPEAISNFYFNESYYGDDQAIGFAIAPANNVNRPSNFYKYSPNEQSLWNWEVVGQAQVGYQNAIHAINKDIVVIGVQTPNPLITRSADGGITWTEVYRAPEEDKYYFNPGKFYFINEQIGFAYEAYVGIGSGPKPDRRHFILRTDDGGLTWNKILLGEFCEGYDSPSFEMIILSMVEIEGKIVATGTHTLFSADQGVSWTQIPSVNGRAYSIEKCPSGPIIVGGSTGYFEYSRDELSADMTWDYFPQDSLPTVADNGCRTCNQSISIASIYTWENTAVLFGSQNLFSINKGGRWDWPTGGNILDSTVGSMYMPSTSHDPTINKSSAEGSLYYLKDNSDRTTAMYRMEIKPE